MYSHTRIVPFAACSLLACALLIAGPLSPPPGPVAPTNKALSEVEPRTAVNDTNTPGGGSAVFIISQPGSYYLTTNIMGASGKSGISITASNVTLDLNGFTLQGVAGSNDGILIAAVSHIAIRDGVVRGWGGAGIQGSIGSNQQFTGVQAHGNGSLGFAVGARSTVSSCVSSLNGGAGLLTGAGVRVTNCVASENAGLGFFLNGTSHVTHCVAFLNGDVGFQLANGSSVTTSSAWENGSSGFSLSFGAIASECTAARNGEDGFQVGASTVTNCTTSLNARHGIVVNGQSVATGNHCYDDGAVAADGAGIFVSSDDNRVEGNSCYAADFGIRVASAGNFIARNTCSGNGTNWSVAANNVCLVVQAVVSGVAFSGNSGGVPPGSSDPNANFTY